MKISLSSSVPVRSMRKAGWAGSVCSRERLMVAVRVVALSSLPLINGPAMGCSRQLRKSFKLFAFFLLIAWPRHCSCERVDEDT